MIIFGMTACGGDEPENGGSTDEPSENGEWQCTLSQDATKFVGRWYGDLDFTFFPNGRVTMISRSSSSNDGFGKWEYDSETRILALIFQTRGHRVVNYQFQVTLSTSDEWTAINLTSGRSVGFKKMTDESYFECYLNSINWESLRGNNISHLKIKADYYSYSGKPFSGSIYDEFSRQFEIKNPYGEEPTIYMYPIEYGSNVKRGDQVYTSKGQWKNDF